MDIAADLSLRIQIDTVSVKHDLQTCDVKDSYLSIVNIEPVSAGQT